MPRLIIRRGPNPGTIYELHNETITIGRGSKNDIVIRDNEVSREHCTLTRVGESYDVRDLGSSNGTFVNGLRIQGAWVLQNNAIIEMGDTITIEYELTSTVKAAAEKPPQVQAQVSAEPSIEPTFTLTMTVGPEMGQIYRLETPTVTIGRDLSNDIVIQDLEISRFHMRLRRDGNQYLVEDLGSTNGTFVNGVGVTEPHPLEQEDVIRLARQVRLQYSCQSELTMAQSDTIAIDQTQFVGKKSERAAQTLGTTSLLLSHRPPSGPLNPTGPLRYAPATPEGLLAAAKRHNPNIQPGSLSDSVFVAYARPDWDRSVSSMVTSLQQAGVTSWIDQYLVQHGDDWRAALEQALSECWMIVVVVSSQSLASNYVKMAYRYFTAQKKPMISFIMDPETTLPPDLTHARSILFDRDNPQRSYHKLILEITSLRR